MELKVGDKVRFRVKPTNYVIEAFSDASPEFEPGQELILLREQNSGRSVWAPPSRIEKDE